MKFLEFALTKGIKIILFTIVCFLAFLGIINGIETNKRVAAVEEMQAKIQETRDFGSVNAVAGITYSLYGSGVGTTDTSITLTDFDTPVSDYDLLMSDFGDIGYLTLEPGNATRQEFISFTGITQNSDDTATLTGVTRGLSPVYPYTASSTIRKQHAGGTQAVLSNPPQFYQNFLNVTSYATSTGVHKWASTTPPRYDMVPLNHNSATVVSTTSEFASIAYVNATALASAPSADESTRGVVEIATRLEAASSTSSGSSGRLAIGASSATDTPQFCNNTTTGGCVVMTRFGHNTIKQAFLNLTEPFSWTAHHIFSSLFATNASSTNATTTNFSITGITSSLLKTNSTGIVQAAVAGTDYSRQQYTFATTTDITTANTIASSSANFVIPAGVMSASSTIEVVASGTCFDGGTDPTCTVSVRDHNTYGLFLSTTVSGATADHTFGWTVRFLIMANNSTSAQKSIATYNAQDNGVPNATKAGYTGNAEGTSAIDTSQAIAPVITFSSDQSSGTMVLNNVSFVVRP